MFTLTIETGNDAFSDDSGDELAEILTNLARYSASLPERGSGTVLDSNGNTVGHWTFTTEDNPGFEVGDASTCTHCDEPITLDDNGAGGTVWIHDFGSTVCHDDPPASIVGTTVAEPFEMAR